MREAHGGIGGDHGEDPVQLAEQQNLFRQIEEARRAAEVSVLTLTRYEQGSYRDILGPACCSASTPEQAALGSSGL